MKINIVRLFSITILLFASNYFHDKKDFSSRQKIFIFMMKNISFHVNKLKKEAFIIVFSIYE